MKTIIGLVISFTITLSASAQWELTQVSVMNEYRESHSSAIVYLPEYGEGVLACGGWTGDAVTASAEFYDISNNQWIPLPDMLTPRMNFAMAEIPGGRIIVAGGYDGVGPLSLASTEIFDIETNEWTPGPDLSVGRSFLRVTRISGNGQLLFTGGYDGNEQVATVDLYDPWTDTITGVAPMNFARSAHTSTRVMTSFPFGSVLVVGGFNPEFGFQMDECEMYDPTTDTWTIIAPLSNPRDNHAATSTIAGWVSLELLVVSGGRVYDPVLDHFVGLANAEIYDLELNEWQQVSIPSAMSYHHSMMDDFGTILVVGGADHTGIGVETTYQGPFEIHASGEYSNPLSFNSENRYGSSLAGNQGSAYCVVSGGDEGGIGTSELWIGTAYSVQEAAQPRNGLFPNPAVDRMRITGERFERWEVIDANGKIVGTGNEWYVEIAHLAAGRYNLAVYNEGTANSYGFVKVSR